MTAIEIVLIIIGFACLCLSYFVAGRSQEEHDEEGVSAAVWTEKEEEMIRERVKTLIEENQMELVDQTEDQMSRICNEKIMAMDEFSRQLLEKMEANHQEVVFMYNLLNEKEKDMKRLMAEPIPVIPAMPEPMAQTEPAEQKETGKGVSSERPKGAVSGRTAVSRTAKKTAEAGSAPRSVPAAGNSSVPATSAAPVQKGNAAPVRTQAVREASEEKEVHVSGSANLQIQKMYREGKSVLEISKALNMGQGEVKLVIALYGGKGR